MLHIQRVYVIKKEEDFFYITQAAYGLKLILTIKVNPIKLNHKPRQVTR